MPTVVLGAPDAHIRARTERPSATAEGETLAATALAAAAAANGAGRRSVGRLVEASARLTGADALRVGLLALADPRLLLSPLDVAIQAHATLLSGLSGGGTAAVWITEPGGEPTLGGYAGAGPASFDRGMLARALCCPRGAGRVVIVRAAGEPRAVITWGDRSDDSSVASALAAHAATYLGLAFERAELLDGNVAQHAALARAAERRLSRVALDLHDGPLQDLALLRGELASLRSTLAQGEARDASRRDPLAQLDDLQAIAEATEADLRELAASTDATKLLQRPFDDALRGVVSAFALRSGIEPLVTLQGSGNDLAAAERGTLLRVIAEALSNAREHSGAARVTMTVRVGADAVEAEISDDGCGFDLERTLPAAARRGSMGLLGMVERVRHLGGTCDVETGVGRGTSIRLGFARTTTDVGHSLHATAVRGGGRVVRAA